MYENVFKRVEEKYILTEEKCNKLFGIIKDNIQKDAYFKTKICNIYFDNKYDELIVTSINKPIYKHKVRLRSYGVPNLDDDVFLEIKFKYKKVVGKRRIKLKLKDYNQYILNKNINNNNQIMKEIDYLFNLYNLKPSYFIAYDRLSYRGLSDTNLRITLDSNLRSRCDNLNLEYGDEGELYFDKDTYIMEIKSLGAMPLWLVNALSSLNIYPTSFSKYGNIYLKDRVVKC